MPFGPPPPPPYAIFHAGETVKVIDENHARFGQQGVVKQVTAAGQTQGVPPDPIGEIDTVDFGGAKSTAMFDPSQLELVS